MRHGLTGLVAIALLASLTAAFVAPEAPAEEPRRTLDMSRVFDAGPLPGAPSDAHISPTPPDPQPLVTRAQWVFDLRWDRGDVWLLGVSRRDLTAPEATPRAMGRFAMELFEGPALIERVRFDFPLLGATELDSGVSLAAKLRTRIGVLFPAASRGTRLELVDRATGRRWSLLWPPAMAAAVDAGT